MDNAISSKQQLDLSVGVSLTAQQVAALTHDIVWMEEQVVNGEEVLVPVLYLAQATNRLAPNGALIQGADVTLIAGANLENSGTLRASSNLSALAGKDLLNTGLVEASNRLDALAGNNIVNKSGGIIAGRDVSVTAVTGDVINQRDLNHTDQTVGFVSAHRESVDNAARIEAANNLTLKAGRDFSNNGSVLQSGGDTRIDAGRDINIAAIASHSSTDYGRGTKDSSVTQTGSTVSAGRDLQMSAGRDLSAIASQIDAKRDIAMAATENLTLSSAADESHFLSKSRRETTQKDHVAQVATTVQAGGDVKLSAGKDLGLIASKVSAGNEAYLVAGDQLDLLSAQNSDYSLYDMKKRGSWGRKKTQHDEVTQVTNVGSEIKTAGNLTLQSGSDQRYQVAKLESGKDLTIESGGTITFEGQKDLHQESHEKTNNNAFWVSSKGSGKTDETLRQTQMVAAGNITIKAVEGLKIDLKQVNQQSVSQTIDAMVKADPQMAWLKDAEKRGDVDWHLVKEIHDSYQYSNSGLGPASQLIIAIVMAAVVGPAVMGAMASTGPVISSGLAAISTSAATNATTSFINNGGNLGAVFKDVTSSDALKGYVISGLMAGLTAKYFDGWTGTKTDPITGKIIGPALNTWTGVGQFAANQALQAGTSTLLSKSLGQGGSMSDALQGALFNTLAAASFNAVGDYTQGSIASGTPQKVVIQAMVGGLLSKASGGDFATGALAAGANEALVEHLDSLVNGDKNLLTMSSQIVGVLAAATQKDADANSLEKGAWIAKNETQYNYLTHQQQEDLAKKLDATCHGDLACMKRELRNTKPLADSQNGFTPQEQSEYDNAQEILTNKLLSNCQTTLCTALTTIKMAEAALSCADISCMREEAGGIQKAQYMQQNQWGKIGLDFLDDAGRVVGALGSVFGVGAVGAKGIQSVIEPKIAQQMGKRGWTADSLESVIANPSKTVVTKDTRFDPISGTRLNDPATGYVAKDGSYVVRNNRTGAIVQVSDKNDKNWVAPWD